ncbi:MAG: ribulose-bisphosphate carboxylase large subunit family protein [Acidobacteriota bacterium]|nr:ribulose-bisphosphate carboxylase large subunit family protein [Acidobacteriota bacterium]
MERIVARYWMETAFPVEEAAATIAGEQSTGTFVAVPGETQALRERYAARMERVQDLGPVAQASLPGSGLPRHGKAERRAAEIELSWPLENMGTSLPNLLATVAGNLWELKALSGLRLLDLSLPAAFLDRYQGPQFGVAGTRSLTGVYDRPILGTILKPSVGMSAAETAAQVRMLAEAGVDFIKDDELQADGPHCPFAERAPAVLQVLEQHARRTGKRVMYAANITGEVDEMLARHDLVVQHGGTCVMVSMNSIGLPAMKVLRAHAKVAIHGHRNGWGLLGRSPAPGMSFVAFQKLWRLAGIDHTHVNGLSNKFCEPDDSVIASARACLTPMFAPPHPGCEVVPVFSSGQTARQAPATFAALGSTDLIFAAGGGILGHPAGPAAGVRSLQQAWEAAVLQIPLAKYAESHGELRVSLESFGG